MTGIRIITGPPGAGKGLYMIYKVVLPCLLDTNQTIVTNFAIDLSALNLWIQQNYPGAVIDLHERICFLSDDEESEYYIKKFFLVRGNGRLLKGVTAEDEKRNIFPSYSDAHAWPPVCYLLDEADLHFGAREYAQHGRSVNYYNKQHRKLGDAVWFGCQAVAQLDKQIRLLTQETIVMKNLGKLRMNLFKLPKLFVFWQYYQVPKGNDSEPLVTGEFKMKSLGGLQDCFKTEVGVGMGGVGADKKEKMPGLPWQLLIVAFAIVFYGVWHFGDFVKWTMNGHRSKPKFVAQRSQKISVTNSPSIVVPAAEKMEMPVKSIIEEKPKIYLTGYAKMTSGFRAFFSDGSSVGADNPDLQFIAEDYVIMRGQVIRKRPLDDVPVVKDQVENSPVVKVPVVVPMLDSLPMAPRLVFR